MIQNGKRLGKKSISIAETMKTYLDCISCFFRQALAAARISSADETIHRRVLNSVALMIPDLALNATPPEIAQRVYSVVYEITGNKDPYLEIKNRANESALDKVATIISSGSEAPATILSQCSSELLSYYHAADVIISKGQGNYESLSARSENIYFLFKVKCPVIAKDSDFDISSGVLAHSKI